MEVLISTLRKCLSIPSLHWSSILAQPNGYDDQSFGIDTPNIVGALQDCLQVQLPLRSSDRKFSHDFGVGLPPLTQIEK
jgi:hypothetical protein